MKLAVKWDGKTNHNNEQAKAESAAPQGGNLPPERQPVLQDETARSACRILVVDDDLNLTRLMSTIFRSAGMHVVTACDGRGALDAAQAPEVDAIVLDLRMPVLDGRSFYRELRARGIETPVLIASAHGAREAQQELGAQGSIEKPFDPEVLLSEVDKVIHHLSH